MILLFALRLFAVQAVASMATAALAFGFAPRLLLLDRRTVEKNIDAGLWATAVVLALEAACTFVSVQRVRRVLSALRSGDSAVDAYEVFVLDALPSRLTLLAVGCGFVTVAATLLPALRPSGSDLLTQLEVLLLTVTLGSVAALLTYVTLRTQVTAVLEGIPEGAKRDALAIRELGGRRLPRIQLRVMMAVTLPVGFVALGASLLAFAHVRAFDANAREADAKELARAVFERVNGSTSGREEASRAAAELGFAVDLEFQGHGFESERDVDGFTTLFVPLDEGRAVVRFATSRLTPEVVVYVLLLIAASVVAASLGSRVGAAFNRDVALVTREVRNLGIADVLRGTRVHLAPKFRFMRDLALAIDELGGVFREFASAQERAIDARAAAERMRGLFLASMSHDLKAPLNAILGFAELASRSDLNRAQQESLAIIEQRGRELLHLIQTILDAARIEAGEFGVSAETTSLGDVVEEALLAARELTNEADVVLYARVDPHLPTTFGDPARLAQALTLVLLTAARFADEGTVRLFAEVASKDEVSIRVEAPGKGLGAADLERIFDTFREPERARKHGSLGLGLFLARFIVELHEGELAAESHTLDGEATDTFGSPPTDARVRDDRGLVLRVRLPVLERKAPRVAD